MINGGQLPTHQLHNIDWGLLDQVSHAPQSMSCNSQQESSWFPLISHFCKQFTVLEIINVQVCEFPRGRATKTKECALEKVSKEIFILEIEDAQTRKFPSACPHTVQLILKLIGNACYIILLWIASYKNVDCQEETYCKKYNYDKSERLYTVTLLLLGNKGFTIQYRLTMYHNNFTQPAQDQSN